MRRRFYENRVRSPRPRSAAQAESLRAVFMDRPAEKLEPVRWEWPRQMQYVGRLEAVMYRSDKWHKRGETRDYKHVAEAEQHLFAQPGVLPGMKPVGPMQRLARPLPDAFAVLADAIGIQYQLFEQDDDGEIFLPPRHQGLYQSDLYHCKVGAARRDGERGAFLIIYDSRRLLFLITGVDLDVQKDGIVG